MTSDPKSFTFTAAVDQFEEIEWHEPVDLDAVSRLIGATEDPRVGARSYLDALEATAIHSLAFCELDREALELSSNVIRSLFDVLANTFIEPYRETNPALAERGRQMLLALLKAASIIGAPLRPIAPKIETDVRDSATRKARNVQKPRDDYADAKLTEAVRKAMNKEGARATESEAYVKLIEPTIRNLLGDELEQPNSPIRKPKGWPSRSTIKKKVRQEKERRKG